MDVVGWVVGVIECVGWFVLRLALLESLLVNWRWAAKSTGAFGRYDQQNLRSDVQ